MPFKLLGLPEEERLAWEEASGIKTEAAKLIYEESVQEAEARIRNALREVQEVIGPHGSITRVQAGGIRIDRAGMGIFVDGVLKTNIQQNGTLVIGSDVSLPATTTEIFFVEDTIYNGEQFDKGDFLIGDNSSGESNVKFDASSGQLQFRGGQTVKAYMDTDGSIKAGGGDVTIDQYGITFANQEGLIQFLDTNAAGTMALYSDGDNWLVIENSFGGKGVSMLLNDGSAVTHQFDFGYDGTINGIAIDSVIYAPKTVMAFADQIIASTAMTKNLDTAQRYNTKSYQTTPADGQTFDIGLFLAAGTYTCTVLGYTDNVSGKLDWTLDAVSQTTGQDWYSAGATNNVEKSFTLTATKSGYQKLRGTINGKNGSSTNYYFTHTAIYILPSAY